MANHYLLIHAHLYQPPRENPWSGEIDPQPSALPWPDWNERIAAECYGPLAEARVYNPAGEIEDIYNNYAHLSFNVGPTLLAWADKAAPALLPSVRRGLAVSGHPAAIAQGYNHSILPLAGARERHKQIVWGLREFEMRFGFAPKGMWLAECGIDPDTVRALIDHGMRFVILSPHQASRVRPFGHPDWQDASMGKIDTRRGYRLFETDGAGRTHFDRFLDVIFYTPGLNLKVSFDHLLSRPADLERELAACYNPDNPEGQLASIVTDGEIYGHHEKRGEEALPRLFRDIAPRLGLTVTSAEEFLRLNPPVWEVKLWNGPDGRGTSWSCNHGVGRWMRNCGCGPGGHPDWNQEWRAPLRTALDNLRGRVDGTLRRELGPILHDAADAAGNYISVVLDPSPASRAAFLLRHFRGTPTVEDAGKFWRLMEAGRVAGLMYTSCGWFFDEISGLEPVQNLSYALRAAELISPFRQGDEEDAAAALERDLAAAKSNLARFGDGAGVLRALVLPRVRSNHELAAGVAARSAAGLPAGNGEWALLASRPVQRGENADGGTVARGAAVYLDRRLDRFIAFSWTVRFAASGRGSVTLHSYHEETADPARAADCAPALPAVPAEGEPAAAATISHDRLPSDVRAWLHRRVTKTEEESLLTDLEALGRRAEPVVARAVAAGVPAPEALRAAARAAADREILRLAEDAVADLDGAEDRAKKILARREAARRAEVEASLDAVWGLTVRTGEEIFARLQAGEGEDAGKKNAERELPRLTKLLAFMRSLGLDPAGSRELAAGYWRSADGFAAAADADAAAAMREIGRNLGFAAGTVEDRLG